MTGNSLFSCDNIEFPHYSDITDHNFFFYIYLTIVYLLTILKHLYQSDTDGLFTSVILFFNKMSIFSE